MAMLTYATRIWARHEVLPFPTDLRDDPEFLEVCEGLSQVAEACKTNGRLSPADQQWLRHVRPDLHRRMLTMPPSGDRGYVESTLSVVDAFLTEGRLA
jgi:hypothetical protein